MWALVNGLPVDAAAFRAQAFTREQELLAGLMELTDRWGRQAALLTGRIKKQQLGRPVRIPRPGEEPKNVVSIAEFVQRNQAQQRG